MMGVWVKNSDKLAKEHRIELKESGPGISALLEKNPDIKKVFEENREKVKLDDCNQRFYRTRKKGFNIRVIQTDEGIN